MDIPHKMIMPKESQWQVYKAHLIMILQLSWPNILTSMISLCLPVSSTLAVGHIGPTVYIGAAALGNMFANASGIAVGQGLAMALDTLCSQAYGAKKYRLVGLHCQRAMVILTIACIPIAIVWYNAWIVLQFIGTKEIADMSQFWIRRLIPSLWPRLMYETYRRYLLSQRIMWPLTVSIAIIVPIHILNTNLFIYKFGWGFEGAVWATCVTYWLLFGTLIGITQLRLVFLRRRALQTGQHVKLKEIDDLFDEDNEEESDSDMSLSEMSEMSESENESESERKGNKEEKEALAALGDVGDGDPLHTWPDWSLDVFRGWVSFFKLGVFTSISLMIEWGSFEVNAAIAARLGEVDLAAHAIMCNSVSVWYSFPIGVATAATALVGNMLGAGHPERAKIFANIAFMIALLYGILNGGLGLLYKDFLGMAFTEDKAVVKLISQMMLVMWLYGLVDAIKAVGMAILRGSGRPAVTVYGNILSCLIVGYPVALAMVFKGGYGMQGLWFGMSTAWFTASCIYGVIVARTDWNREVLRAAERNADAEKTTQRGAALAKEGMLLRVVVKAGSEEDGAFSIINEDEEKGEGEKDSFLVNSSGKGEKEAK